MEWTQTHEPPWYNAVLLRYQTEAAELISQQPSVGNEKSEEQDHPPVTTKFKTETSFVAELML